MILRKEITDQEHDERTRVIREALTWELTPFAWEQMCKGSGVDCGRFLVGALNGSGVRQIDASKVPHWSPQWFLHKREGDPSPFIEQIVKLIGPEYQLEPGCVPLPADIIVAKCGRDWAHSAMVIEWPKVIACASGHCVVVWNDLRTSAKFGKHPLRYFDPFAHAGLQVEPRPGEEK
jgi:hypothetical protein